MQFIYQFTNHFHAYLRNARLMITRMKLAFFVQRDVMQQGNHQVFLFGRVILQDDHIYEMWLFYNAVMKTEGRG